MSFIHSEMAASVFFTPRGQSRSTRIRVPSRGEGGSYTRLIRTSGPALERLIGISSAVRFEHTGYDSGGRRRVPPGSGSDAHRCWRPDSAGRSSARCARGRYGDYVFSSIGSRATLPRLVSHGGATEG